MRFSLKLLAFIVSLSILYSVQPASVAYAVEVETSAEADETVATEETLPEEELPDDNGIQVVEMVDYSEHLNRLEQTSALNNELLQYIAGFNLFFVIVLICYFGYRFFRMFF